jgi:hypothetical protein
MLAYVQMFQIATTADPNSGMYKVKKLPIHEVIEIDVIERAVHLIPCFGNARETKIARAEDPPTLDQYDQFYINNHVNVDMFNTIY